MYGDLNNEAKIYKIGLYGKPAEWWNADEKQEDWTIYYIFIQIRSLMMHDFSIIIIIIRA